MRVADLVTYIGHIFELDTSERRKTNVDKNRKKGSKNWDV